MAYLTNKQLSEFGFKSLGNNIKVSDKASIYNPELISIGNHSRIDDFCVISGKITIGRNVHITPMCLVAGGEKGIIINDFVTFAYGVQVFTQSDDYSGKTMTNSTVPDKYKKEIKKEIRIEKYSIIGAGSIIMPGVILNEGTAIGAMSLVRKKTEPWSVYVGSPATKIKNRKKDLLKLAELYLIEKGNDASI